MKMDAIRLIAGAGLPSIGIVDGPVIDLPLPSVYASGPFVLKRAEGLGPTNIGVRLQRSVAETTTYQGRNPALRQLIFSIGIQPDYRNGEDVDSLRTTLYQLLSTRYNLPITIQIMWRGDVQAQTKGYASQFEPTYFEKEPAVVMSIDCDSAYFEAPQPVQFVPTVRPNDAPVNGVDWRSFDVVNEGTAPANFVFGIRFGATPSATSILIADETGGGAMMMVDGVTWNAGDVLLINTNPRVRNMWRIPSGSTVRTSILNNRNPGSSWMELHSGRNRLLVNASNYTISSAYPFSYTPRYWGL